MLTVGSHANDQREPGQVRKEAAISVSSLCRGLTRLELAVTAKVAKSIRRRVHGLFMLSVPSQPHGHHIESLNFQGRFDSILEMRLSGVAEQGYTMLYGKSRLKLWWENDSV